MIDLPLVRYTLLAVRRDRIVQLLLVLMLLATGASHFLGSAATIEEKAFTIASSATSLRLIAVLGLVVFISFFMRRAFDNREIDYLLGTPLGRLQLLGSFALAFMILAIFLAVMIAGIVGVLSFGLTKGWIMWSASVVVEMTVTAMLALFFACVLRSATVATLCSLGYYTLARMMGVMIGIVTFRTGDTDTLAIFSRFFVQVMSVITPRFDLLAQSGWLVYGDNLGLTPTILLVQWVVFVALYFACAAYDLRRVQF